MDDITLEHCHNMIKTRQNQLLPTNRQNEALLSFQIFLTHAKEEARETKQQRRLAEAKIRALYLHKKGSQQQTNRRYSLNKWGKSVVSK